MPDYDIYAAGRTIRSQPIGRLNADDDGEAMQLARLRMEDIDVELWRDGRKVADVPKTGPLAPLQVSNLWWCMVRTMSKPRFYAQGGTFLMAVTGGDLPPVCWQSALDRWINQQDPKPTRPEAILRLVEAGLAVKAK